MRSTGTAFQVKFNRSDRGSNLAFSVGLAYKSESSLMLKC